MYGNDNSFSEGYIIGRDSNGNSNGNVCGDGFGNSAWWIIILLIFGWGGFGNGFGYGNNGRGGGNNCCCDSGSSGGSVRDNYILASDFSNIERKIDGVNNGICDGFYAVNTSFGNLNNTLASNFAGVQNTLTQGFAGLNAANIQQGYESRIATQGVSSQLAQCCCDIREGIQANTTQGVLNTNALQSQLAQCCCDNRAAIADTNYNIATQANNIGRQIADTSCATQRQIERGFADIGYNMAAQNCNTLQAIDRVGDRIVDYLAAEKTERLRDENQALRLAASQQAQNNYLVSQLKAPCPIPAYTVPNPNCCYQPTYAGCGCN